MRRSRLIIHRSFASEHAAGQRAGAAEAEVTVATAVARCDPLPQIIFEFMLRTLHITLGVGAMISPIISDFARMSMSIVLTSKSNVRSQTARMLGHPVSEKTGLNPLFVLSTSVQNLSRSNAVATSPSPRANGWDVTLMPHALSACFWCGTCTRKWTFKSLKFEFIWHESA